MTDSSLVHGAYQLPARTMSTYLQQRRKRKKQLLAAVVAIAGAAVILDMLPYMYKVPQNTSVLTGHAWIRELLAGHLRRFHNMLGMSKHVFCTLANELQRFSVSQIGPFQTLLPPLYP